MSEFKYIITIGREFGAGGRTIARRISDILEIPFYDEDIITLTAEKTGFSEQMIEDTEEHRTARNILNWLLPMGASSSYDSVIMAQAQTIRKIAKEGPCVIVGRGADYILRDMPNVINVFLTADEADQVKYSMEKFDEDEDQALRRVNHSNAARESYYHYLTRNKWADLHNYHLSLNTSQLGKEACADIIIAYAQRLKEQKS